MLVVRRRKRNAIKEILLLQKMGREETVQERRRERGFYSLRR